MEKLYNHEEKIEFLDSLSEEDVKKIYYYLFLKSKGAETLYKKDLYAFNLNQIEDVMRNINPSTMNSAANSKSRINNYITWAIRNGRRNNNISPIHGLSRDWENKFIDKTAKRYLTDSEMHDLTESLHNAQDQALIQCIYEGVLGQGFSELLSLRSSKIDWDNNELTVYNTKTEAERTVVVSNRCMRYLENAYKQTVYLSEDTENEKDLIDYQDYILKNVQWKSSKFDKPTMANLSKRIFVIKEKYELDEFTAKTISESGRIKMASDLYEKYGKIDKEEFDLIGERYGLTKIKVNNYEYFDISKFKYYINSSTMKELYDIEVEIE